MISIRSLPLNLDGNCNGDDVTLIRHLTRSGIENDFYQYLHNNTQENLGEKNPKSNSLIYHLLHDQIGLK